MKTSTKAILASAFVFPGLGQLILKRYISGIGFVSTAAVALLVVLAYVWSIAKRVVDQVLNTHVQAEFLTLHVMVKNELANSNSFILNVSLIVLLLLWMTSIIDTYRLGKLENQ